MLATIVYRNRYTNVANTFGQTRQTGNFPWATSPLIQENVNFPKLPHNTLFLLITAAETAASHLRHTATGKVETGATGRHSATVPPRPPHTESGNLRAEGRTGVAAATTVVVETRKRPAPRKFPASPECGAWASGQNILARRGKDTTTTASRKSRVSYAHFTFTLQ